MCDVIPAAPDLLCIHDVRGGWHKIRASPTQQLSLCVNLSTLEIRQAFLLTQEVIAPLIRAGPNHIHLEAALLRGAVRVVRDAVWGIVGFFYRGITVLTNQKEEERFALRRRDAQIH